jgi:hypothetical protein
MKPKKKKKKKYFDIVELVISDMPGEEELAIDAISLVSDPAIQESAVFFNKQKNNLTLAKETDEERVLISPALIPNKSIYRYNADEDKDFYVYFSEETVRRSSEMFLKYQNQHKATYEHERPIDDVYVMESWIIEDTKKDKSSLYNFALPKGTWMVKMRINNDEVWSDLKSGKLTGLSIEGFFVNRMQKMSEVKHSDNEVLEALAEILNLPKIK